MLGRSARPTRSFVLSQSGRKRQLLSQASDDWTITFVDTGLRANVGMRLKAVEVHLSGDECVLANYADGL